LWCWITWQIISARISGVNGRIHDVEAMQEKRRRRPRMGIQTGLLVFTLSSLTLVFAGSALAFVAIVLYSVLFG